MKIVFDGRVRMSGFGKNRASVPFEARKSFAAEWKDAEWKQNKAAFQRREFASLHAMLDELPDQAWVIT